MNMMEVEEKPLNGSSIDPEAEISVADMQVQLQESALPTDDLNLCESVPGVVNRGDDDQEMLHCPDEKNQADVQVDDADVHQLPEDKITNSDTCDAKVEDASLHQLPENNITISNTCTVNHLKVDVPASPKKSSPKKSLLRKAPEMKYGLDDSEMGEADESGTSEERAAFMTELESFYRENTLEFKPPKFYGEPLNCLKLWRAVIRLGGYDVVTAAKLWRQVGESFHPPKTCTTVSWTFRIFYEKALLEYEKHKKQIGELQFPVVGSLVQSAGIEEEIWDEVLHMRSVKSYIFTQVLGSGYQAPGSGRARRDSAARAMQGWHAQKLLSYGEVAEPVIKDKNLNSTAKREKNLKSIGFLKHRSQINTELNEKASNIDSDKQLITTIVDVGQPADWVKITVRETKDSFEVYALVPGLLREEVRVQSDPAGRLVITGQPQQLDNPWGITPFKKVVTLPGRIDPLQTSAVVSLHGRLFVRVPFERGSV